MTDNETTITIRRIQSAISGYRGQLSPRIRGKKIVAISCYRREDSAPWSATFAGRKYSTPITNEELAEILAQTEPLTPEQLEALELEAAQAALSLNAYRMEHAQQRAIAAIEKIEQRIEWALRDIRRERECVEAGDYFRAADVEIIGEILSMTNNCSLQYLPREWSEYVTAAKVFEEANMSPLPGAEAQR